LPEGRSKPKTIVKSVRLHPVFLDEIQSACKNREVDFSTFIRQATLGALRNTSFNNSNFTRKGALSMEASKIEDTQEDELPKDDGDVGDFNYITGALFKDSTIASKTKESMNFADEVLSIQDKSIFIMAVFFDK
jgi:hypothetical protein